LFTVSMKNGVRIHSTVLQLTITENAIVLIQNFGAAELVA
jgi:hypothetical protein